MLKLCWEVTSSNEQWAKFLKARFFRSSLPVTHHVSSSLWPALKVWFPIIKEHSSWLIGNGHSVNFWTDKWLPEPLANLMNIPSDWQQDLSAKVSDFIVDNLWNIPYCLQHHFPSIMEKVCHTHIPIEPCEDRLVWDSAANGLLTFKDAFLFLNPVRNLAPGFSQIWSKAIPPSRSFLVWRLFHHKMPTDENIRRRGYTLASMCSLCTWLSRGIFFPSVPLLQLCSCSVGLVELKTVAHNRSIIFREPVLGV